jgi:hypothetical protein
LQPHNPEIQIFFFDPHPLSHGQQQSISSAYNNIVGSFGEHHHHRASPPPLTWTTPIQEQHFIFSDSKI